MATGDLTTLAHALAWLGLTADDTNGTIARLISACSAQIQQFISRTIASTAYAKTFNGRGGSMLMLPDYPVTAVASVAVNGIAVPARVLGSRPGFAFDDKTVYLDSPYRFTRGAQNVQISYTAGYASTPLDIEQACLDWIKMVWDAKGLDVGASVSMMKAGDHALMFGNVITQLNRGVIPLPPPIFAKLQPYSRVFPA